jgi:hypothetical protein
MLMADMAMLFTKINFLKDLDDRGHEICVSYIVVMEWGRKSRFRE